MVAKEIEILTDSTLKRPPSFKSKFFKLYSPKKIILNPDEHKQIDLKFKGKIPENLNNQIMLSPVFRDNCSKYKIYNFVQTYQNIFS